MPADWMGSTCSQLRRASSSFAFAAAPTSMPVAAWISSSEASEWCSRACGRGRRSDGRKRAEARLLFSSSGPAPDAIQGGVGRIATALDRYPEIFHPRRLIRKGSVGPDSQRWTHRPLRPPLGQSSTDPTTIPTSPQATESAAPRPSPSLQTL
eukprot:scaffold306457_cov28-Tisochrysis_lutea.AAC.3